MNIPGRDIYKVIWVMLNNLSVAPPSNKIVAYSHFINSLSIIQPICE